MGLVELGEAPLMCLVLLPLHRHLGMVVDDLEGVGYKTCKPFAFSVLFCLGTGVPRHSAGGVGTFVRTYVRGTWYVSFAMRMRE